MNLQIPWILLGTPHPSLSPRPFDFFEGLVPRLLQSIECQRANVPWGTTDELLNRHIKAMASCWITPVSFYCCDLPWGLGGRNTWFLVSVVILQMNVSEVECANSPDDANYNPIWIVDVCYSTGTQLRHYSMLPVMHKNIHAAYIIYRIYIRTQVLVS